MDRNYYYRILGLTEGATGQQIKQAYETRMAKLDSDDYRDDPEYVAKKKRQTTEAYKVLTGSAPSSTKAQREARFERLKDYIEQKESGEKTSKGSFKPFGRVQYTPKNKKLVFTVVVISVAIFVIAIVAAVMFAGVDFSKNVSFDFLGSHSDSSYSSDDSDDYSYDYDDLDIFDDHYDSGYDIDEQEQIDEAQQKLLDMDYYGGLDFSAVDGNADKIDWDYSVGSYGGSSDDGIDDTMDNTFSLMFSLQIYGVSDFFSYVTGEANYYFDHDDYDCAVALINWMGAPPFEDVAGCVDTYSGEPILTIADYLSYLESVINENYN